MSAPGGQVLQSASEVVIGASDIEATKRFLALFGFSVRSTFSVDADSAQKLFGCGRSLEAVRLTPAASPDAAGLLLISGATEPSMSTGYDLGPRALDIYASDLDATIGALATGGFAASPIGGLSAGPMTMRQAMFVGPDGLAVVVVETTHRRSSIIDTDADLLHSEPHSVVWVVADQTTEAASLSSCGLIGSPPIEFSEPSISDELGLADSPTPIAMSMFADESVASIRLELMTFLDHVPAGTGPVGIGPVGIGPVGIGAGVWALRYDVNELPTAATGFASLGERASLDGAPAVVSTTTGGIRFILTESADPKRGSG